MDHLDYMGHPEPNPFFGGSKGQQPTYFWKVQWVKCRSGYRVSLAVQLVFTAHSFFLVGTYIFCSFFRSEHGSKRAYLSSLIKVDEPSSSLFQARFINEPKLSCVKFGSLRLVSQLVYGLVSQLVHRLLRPIVMYNIFWIRPIFMYDIYFFLFFLCINSLSGRLVYIK